MDEIDIMWTLFVHRLSKSDERSVYCWIDDEPYLLRGDSFQLGRDVAVSEVKFTYDEDEAVVTFSGKEYEMKEVCFGDELLRIEQRRDVLPTEAEWDQFFQFLDELDGSNAIE